MAQKISGKFLGIKVEYDDFLEFEEDGLHFRCPGGIAVGGSVSVSVLLDGKFCTSEYPELCKNIEIRHELGECSCDKIHRRLNVDCSYIKEGKKCRGHFFTRNQFIKKIRALSKKAQK
jgi:hypothetical protein